MFRLHTVAAVGLCGCLAVMFAGLSPVLAESAESELAAAIRALDANVISVEGNDGKETRERLRRMIGKDVGERLREGNLKDVFAFRKIKNRAEWERSTQTRIEALRRSLGSFPEPPEELKVRVTRSDKRDGYVVENIVFESRPGLLVTAHLYRPEKPNKSMPGIVISHSHHRPKEQGELQQMGANWARRGCVVVVPDHVGHGERRQHPFRAADDYPDSFRVSRQDYYFRYNVGMQLHIAGDSLIGWMVWDLSRCVDLLLSQPGVDKNRIIMLGAVAGGGDPCAVTAAVDTRIAAAVPFNFGGPQPESRANLGDDAELTMSYSGSGGWESTRNLRLSVRDGFFHYVIVGSIAPRKLIYAHEFTWDRPHDPVWKRFQTLWGDRYGVRDSLAFTHGYGQVTLSSAKASHCTNIGRFHRKLIDPAFEKWFGIEPPDEENHDSRETADTLCLAGPKAKGIRLKSVSELASGIAVERIAAMRKTLDGKSVAEKRKLLRTAWSRVLGDVEPYMATVTVKKTEPFAGGRVERIVIGGERAIELPLLLLSPKAKEKKKYAAVVMFAQSGKAELLERRSDVIASLLGAGVVVCLPDLRGTGETAPSDYRGRRSYATGISSSELMLGQTLVGSRLKDLRTVLAVLRKRGDVDAERIAIWGDSLAAVNGANDPVDVPLGIDFEPNRSEPLGHMLALLAGLYEEDVAAIVAARGGLLGFGATLASGACHFPHDIVVPGAVTAGDLSDLAAIIAPRPLLISGLVNGVNRVVSASAVDDANAPARSAYQASKAGERLVLKQGAKPDAEFARWVIESLSR
jgi:dienelactone hydrolase